MSDLFTAEQQQEFVIRQLPEQYKSLYCACPNQVMIPENQRSQFSEQQMEILQERANGVAQEFLYSMTQQQQQQQQPS